jgi:hypothetical protein
MGPTTVTSNAETRADVVVYRHGIVHCSVCAPADLAQNEVESAVNLENPAGTSEGWKVIEPAFSSGETNPCVCHDGRQHWLMTC